MFKAVGSLVGGVIIGQIIRFMVRQFLVGNANYLFDPIIVAIWSHLKLGHKNKSALTCPECAGQFYSMPN